MKWEYRLTQVGAKSFDEDVEKICAEGWELMQADLAHNGVNRTYWGEVAAFYYCIFRRRVSP